MKRFTALLLLLVMLLGCLPFAASGAENALSVTFYNALPGSAAGEIAFTAEKAGTYGLYWTDASGAALQADVGGKKISYTSLADLTVKAGETRVFSPQPFTAIPYGARNLAVLDSAKNVVASWALPEDKLQKKEQNYAYGVMSDLHYNSFTEGGKDVAVDAVDAAYAFYKEHGVQYVFQTGDYSTNADEEAYKRYAAGVEKSGLTVLGCGGNHEVVAGAEKMYGKNGLWYKYVNKGVYDNTLDGVLEIAPDGHSFAFRIPGTDDVFVSVDQIRWDGRTLAEKSLVDPEIVQWLGQTLEKYKDLRLHMLMHTFLSDDDHENVDGEGDITNSVGYGYHYNYNVTTPEEDDIRAILEQYDEMIWFNGHSHWIYSMQSFNENLVVYDYGGTTATFVHVPSVTAPRTVSDTETSYHSNAGKYSEGSMMFSCDGYEVLNGINFKTGEIYAYGCYILYEDADTLVKGSDGKTEWVFDRQLSSLRITGEGAVSAASAPKAEFAESVRSLYVSRGITTIGKDVFANLPNLAKIELKDTVEAIGDGVFENCKALRTVVLPATLKTIGENAFKGTENLTVAFHGTEEKALGIVYGKGNEPFTGAKKTYDRVTVSWQIDNYKLITEVPTGEVPVYPEKPSIPNDNPDKTYTFTGWNNGKTTYAAGKTLPKATAAVTYTAQFGEETDRYVTGSLSDKVTFRLDRYNGVLYIEGSGATPDYTKANPAPIAKYDSEIYTAVVTGKIHTVGGWLFSGLSCLRTLIFEKGVRSVKSDAFSYCNALTTVYIPQTLTSVSSGASYSCASLTTVYFAGQQSSYEAFVSKQVNSTYNDPLRFAPDIHTGASSPVAKTFTVTFLDCDGNTVGKEEKVVYGEGVKAPEIADERFDHWDSPYFIVTGDLTVRAVEVVKAPDPPAPDEPTAPTEPSDVQTETGSETAPPSESGNEQKPVSPVVWILICCALVAVAAVVIVIVLVNKKKRAS